MDFYYLGKKILFFSFALLTGLYITQVIIQVHSPEQDDKVLLSYRQESGFVSTGNHSFNTRIRENLESLTGVTDQELLSIKSDIVQERLASHHKKGSPFALLVHGDIYLIDHRGNILCYADSAKHYDLPVITGDSLKTFGTTLRLGGDEIEQALAFIKYIKKNYSSVYGNISEIHVDPKIGLVVNTNLSRGLPLIIGKGDIEEKAQMVYSFIKELGQTDLAYQARYLDFRLKGQIILKKRV